MNKEHNLPDGAVSSYPGNTMPMNADGLDITGDFPDYVIMVSSLISLN